MIIVILYCVAKFYKFKFNKTRTASDRVCQLPKWSWKSTRYKIGHPHIAMKIEVAGHCHSVLILSFTAFFEFLAIRTELGVKSVDTVY